MPVVESKERFLDFGVTKKFGKGFEYGQKIYGQGFYGEEETEFPRFGYGLQLYGLDLYGDDNLRWGIYQRRYSHWKLVNGKRKYYGKRTTIRENFMVPKQTITETKTANWNKFKAGMEAWKLLTAEEKQAYNREANKLHLHGVNLFLRRWLRSY